MHYCRNILLAYINILTLMDHIGKGLPALAKCCGGTVTMAEVSVKSVTENTWRDSPYSTTPRLLSNWKQDSANIQSDICYTDYVVTNVHHRYVFVATSLCVLKKINILYLRFGHVPKERACHEGDSLRFPYRK